MKGYLIQIEDATRDNQYYRRVLFTAQHSQLVLMSLKPGEEIGEEVHELDQFIRFEEGEGTVVLDGEKHAVSDGFAVVIPAGTRHNVVNSGKRQRLSCTVSIALRNIKMESFTKRSRKPTRITIIILTVGLQ